MTLSGIETTRFGLAAEATRGTAETSPTRWIATKGKPDLKAVLKHIANEGIRGDPSKLPPIKGVKECTGKVMLQLDPQVCVEFFQSLLCSSSGGLTSAEDSEITIDTTNNKLDFDIGGSQLHATIASASYPIGLTQADAGSLCKAIKDALASADGTGTYTVTYSRTTKKFTITRSAGTLNLKFATGTNVATSIAATLGFAATDLTGALTYTGTVTVEWAFTHTLLRSGVEPRSLTLFEDYALAVKKYNLACAKAISMKIPPEGKIDLDIDLIMQDEADGSIGSPAYDPEHFLTFEHVAIKLATVQNTEIKDFSLKLDNGAIPHRPLRASPLIKNVLANGKMGIDGGFTVFFESEAERNKFLANTGVAIHLDILGDTIIGSSKYGMVIDIYEAHYTAFPFDEDENLLAAKATFEGFYSSSDGKAIQVKFTNQVASYS